MNSNIIRTLLTVAAAAVVLLPVFFGCASLATGGFDCSASWVSPVYSGAIAMVLMVLGMAVKALDGTGLFSTTSTAFRTGLTVLSFVVTAAMVVAACGTDAVTGSVTCTAQWLSPQLAGLVSGVLLGLNQLVKAFDGTTLTKPVA
jgi:hypothetical protein